MRAFSKWMCADRTGYVLRGGTTSLPGMERKRTMLLIAGVCSAVATWLLLHGPLGLPTKAAWCGAITMVCAVWWVTEPIPIPATSLIPFAAFPLTGVLDHKDVATSYGHSLILLLVPNRQTDLPG